MLLGGPLPVALEHPANRRSHRVTNNPHRQVAVAFAAVIFQPCGVGCVLVQVLRADKVMLARHHAAQAREERFSAVRVGASEVAVGFLVIDAPHGEAARQVIPVAGLVSKDDRARQDVTGNQINAVSFGGCHERQGTAFASADGYDDAAGAGLVTCAATVNAVFAQVGRADMATEISAINLDFAGDFAAFVFILHGLADFVGEDPCRLVLNAKLAGKLIGEREKPFF